MYSYLYPYKRSFVTDLMGNKKSVKTIFGVGHIAKLVGSDETILCGISIAEIIGGGNGVSRYLAIKHSLELCPKCQTIYKQQDKKYLSWVSACRNEP